jgi:hypothetical protein
MSQEPWDDDTPGEPWDEDPEGPQACDLEGSGDDDEPELVPCPHCGQEVSELAQQCPHCGDWIIAGAGGDSRRRPLLVVIAILLLIAFLLWVL